MEWRLTDTARDELAALDADGVKYSAQDVLAIQRLSIDIEQPDSGGMDLARGSAVEVGGAVLWPFTLAGAAFFRDACAADPDNELWSLRACAYAMSFGRDTERIYRRGEEARRDIDRYWWTIRATTQEVARAVRLCLASDPPDVADTNNDNAEIVSLALYASSMIGGSPEMWETQCSIPSIRRIVRICETNSLALGSKGGPSRAKKEALRKLGLYVASIRKRCAHG